MVRKSTIILTFCSIMAFTAASLQAGDHSHKGDHKLDVESPWARIILTSRPGAAFMKIDNKGAADRLIGARSPLAEKIELHTHSNENGVFRMRPIEALEVPAGAALELKPGGDHVMLFGLAENIKENDAIPLTLIFEKAGEVTVSVSLTPPEKAAGGHGADHSGHGDGHSGHGEGHSGHGDGHSGHGEGHSGHTSN